MRIENCNSIFELFCAFNFAYAILSEPTINENDSLSTRSSSFADVIDSYLLKPFSNYFDEVKNPIELKIDTLKSSIRTYMSRSEDHEKVEMCDILLKSADYSSRKLNLKKVELKNEKLLIHEKINTKFPYLSFLLGLFCISVLVLAASESEHKHFSLLLIDLVLLIIMILYFFRGEKSELNYRNIIEKFTIGLSFVLLMHFICKFYIKSEYVCFYKEICCFLDKSDGLRPFFILFNMVIPFSHFIFYFFVFRNAIKTSRKNTKEFLSPIISMIADIEKDYNEFPDLEV